MARLRTYFRNFLKFPWYFPLDLSILFAKYSCFSKNNLVWQYWFTLAAVPIIPLYFFHDNFRINGSLPARQFKNFPVVSYKLPEFKSRLLSHYLRVIRSVLGVTVSHFELVFFLSFSYIFPHWSKKAGAKMVLMSNDFVPRAEHFWSWTKFYG